MHALSFHEKPWRGCRHALTKHVIAMLLCGSSVQEAAKALVNLCMQVRLSAV